MKIPPEVLAVLNVAAPTLATAFGGPLAGAAASVAARALIEYIGVDAADLPKVTPQEIVSVIQEKKADPDFVSSLRFAELELKAYEAKEGFQFAQLIAQDRANNREFQGRNALARPLMNWGMGIVTLTLTLLFGVIAASLLLVAGIVRIPFENVQMAVGVFGLIGSIVGYIASYGTQIITFYWTDSALSGDKTEALSEALQTSGVQLAEAAASAGRVAAKAADKPPAPAPAPPQVVVVPAAQAAPIPAAPAGEAEWKVGPYGGARWQVTPAGVIVEGASGVARTVGQPVTVRRAWTLYGALMQAECLKRGVPVEIGMMVLCTESGSALNAAATLVEPDKRVSSGIMQVLTGTASDMLKRSVTVDDLQNPQISIEAGVAYIQHQKKETWFDPILTAAAYNAGGLYPSRQQDSNRFNLRSTGDHLERAIRWYGDICFVAKEDKWF